jgi:hypothetical protein
MLPMLADAILMPVFGFRAYPNFAWLTIQHILVGSFARTLSAFDHFSCYPRESFSESLVPVHFILPY